MNKVYLDPGIYYIENFISDEELNLILKQYNEEDGWVENGVFYQKEVMDELSRDLLYTINKRINDLINNEYEMANPSLSLQKFLPTSLEWSINPHSDRFDYKEVGTGESRSMFCTKGFVLYFNDSYEGGEIYYTEKDILFRPKSKMFLVHDASNEYKHGVKAVTSGERFMTTGFVYEREYLEKEIWGIL